MKASQTRRSSLVVRALSSAATRGVLTLGGWSAPCALGRSGRRAIKREGDGATPIGRWELRTVHFRADRGRRPRTSLPVQALRRDDGWCDAACDRNYNRHVRHPYPASAEQLWRDDGVYDVIVTTSHNVRPRLRGGGSAIFMHLARPGFAPTAGCVALTLRDLRHLLAVLPARAVLVVPA